MAQLTGNAIQSSYLGLIKTTDNAAISGTAKAITDGAGNATNIQMSNTSTNFVSGTVDFTGSTVSGLPVDPNTTYDLASAQNAANVDVTLTGSDATTDTVTLAAGTNITLTDNGSNQITIDAAGGGGGTTSFQGTAWTLSTQASSDIVYETFMIPGGTFTTGDVVEITGLEYRNGMNNWGYSSLWISDAAQTVGQAPVSSSGNYSFAQVQSSSARVNVYYNKTLFIKSNGTMHMPIGGSNNVDAEGSGDPTETVNINWAVNQYFFYQFYNDSTAGSITTSGTLIKKLN